MLIIKAASCSLPSKSIVTNSAFSLCECIYHVMHCVIGTERKVIIVINSTSINNPQKKWIGPRHYLHFRLWQELQRICFSHSWSRHRVLSCKSEIMDSATIQMKKSTWHCDCVLIWSTYDINTGALPIILYHRSCNYELQILWLQKPKKFKFSELDVTVQNA